MFRKRGREFGYDLFQYLDENGKSCRVGSADVNEYLKEITGQEFTAKEFRTWSGTVLMARELNECGPFDSPTDAKRKVVGAVKAVSQKLGNKPATCRAYYIHPRVIDAYMANELPGLKDLARNSASEADLSPEELCVLQLIAASTSKESGKTAA